MAGELECVYISLHKKEWQYVRDTKSTIRDSSGAAWRMVDGIGVEAKAGPEAAGRRPKPNLGDVALVVVDLHAKMKNGNLLPLAEQEMRPAELKDLLPDFSAPVIIAAACYQGDADKTCMAEWGKAFPDSSILFYSGEIEHTVAAKDMRLIAETLAILGPDLPPAGELFEPLMRELDWDEHVRRRNARRTKSQYIARWVAPGSKQ